MIRGQTGESNYKEVCPKYPVVPWNNRIELFGCLISPRYGSPVSLPHVKIKHTHTSVPPGPCRRRTLWLRIPVQPQHASGFSWHLLVLLGKAGWLAGWLLGFPFPTPAAERLIHLIRGWHVWCHHSWCNLRSSSFVVQFLWFVQPENRHI